MTKFTTEHKLAVVKRYLEGNESFHSIGKLFGTSHTEVINWVAQYKQNGIDGLLKKSYTSYTVQFKLDVILTSLYNILNLKNMEIHQK